MNNALTTIAIGTELYSRHDGALTVTAVGPFLTATTAAGKSVRFPAALVVKADARGLANRAAVFVAQDYCEAFGAKMTRERGAGCAQAWRETGMRSLRAAR